VPGSPVSPAEGHLRLRGSVIAVDSGCGGLGVALRGASSASSRPQPLPGNRGFEPTFAGKCGPTFRHLDRAEPLRSVSGSSHVNDSMRLLEAGSEGDALMMASLMGRPCPPEGMLRISERPQALGPVRSVGAPGQLHHDGPPEGSPENDTFRKVEDHDGVRSAEDQILGVVRMTVENPAARGHDGLDRGVELGRVVGATDRSNRRASVDLPLPAQPTTTTLSTWRSLPSATRQERGSRSPDDMEPGSRRRRRGTSPSLIVRRGSLPTLVAIRLQTPSRPAQLVE
jgi:hypothetical protein